MLHVKNAVLVLHVKWMDRLCKDMESSWLRFIWPLVSDLFGVQLLAGARVIWESDLSLLTPFYALIVHSYLTLNNLFYQKNASLPLPRNLWFIPEMHFKHEAWCSAGFQTVLDLPLIAGKINVDQVKSVLGHEDCSWYLWCCTFQKVCIDKTSICS